MEEEGDDKDDSKRRTRNLSEKKRRDQFNTLVNELNMMISTNNRKMDKSTVLRSAISFLKNHNEVTVRSRAHDVQEDWKPSFLANEEFTYLVLEAMEGFILVFSGNGRINHVSESIMSLLGHNPNDILNTSIYDLIPDVDKQHIYNILHHSLEVDSLQPVSENENEIRFQCHLKRGALDFRDELTYELIDFVGRVRTNGELSDTDEPCHSSDASRSLFVCSGRLHTPQLIRDVTLLDSNNEFISRHSLEWKFLFLDHRAPPIIGYLPFEVLGTSGYDYYHFDDLENVINCHETLMQKGELTSCYYRFLTKGQQWIWLQTRFYITYHQWNSKPEFVICTHRVVSHDDMLNDKKTENLKEEACAEEAESSSSLLLLKEPRPEDTAPHASPSYYSDNNDDHYLYTPKLEVLSVNTASQSSSCMPVLPVIVVTSAANTAFDSVWSGDHAGSDCASVSCKPPYQQRDDSNVPGLVEQSAMMPQHNLGGQYLEVMPCKTTHRHDAPKPAAAAVLPPLPVVLSHDHAQAQDELQRKHEQLQQMIMQQQEELRQVKEQLMMARLGVLHPIVPVQSTYPGPEAQPPVQNIAPQVVYDTSHNVVYLPPQQAPHVANHHHPHMPQ